MAELRWNPIMKDWIMVASNRQSRPQMPKDWCPFCPGSGKVPDSYDVYRYPNDFPALSSNPPEPDSVNSSELFKVAPSYGRCDVLLYSPDHHGTVANLSDEHIHKLAHMWLDVFRDMKADKKIKYAYIFENRGAEVGVTMPHPHGQAYGYPYIPKVIEQESLSAKEYMSEKGSCLFCDLLKAEISDKRRMIFENKHFAVFIPFYSNWTYGCHLYARRHVGTLDEMTNGELASLGEAVRAVSGMYDSLFGKLFPYMMCMHNAPINTDDPELEKAFHFHIEFMPPMRSENVQQFRASSESGAGAWCNPNCPEDKAIELRAAYKKYTDSRK
ncbi:MAG: galactose-1-phosphate uridylyltransferase [Oscillospiraceae bacterium]